LNAHVSQGSWPVLVLNADFRPLSYYPLSLWSWQDAIKAVFLDRVNIVAHYDQAVHSPTLQMQLPSVVSLKSFVKPTTHPAFTRFNVFLRARRPHLRPHRPAQQRRPDHLGERGRGVLAL
jgi:5-methylcytosine-specific restriction endonuclease McrA